MDPARAAPGERLVLGTAGHIDHGKTALTRALTGVDTDRLPEEKARGISLELGFAPLDLGDGLRLSLVDVPGHERLVRTMVAGATGIDLVLLAVAADEGVMPQTREHVAVCDVLGLERGVVALTKSDRVDAEVVGLARDEAVALLAGTGLAGAPVVAVSAVTGAGLDALRNALRDEARRARPRTPRGGPPRLPVDRVFSVRGFGTVVTGTLVGGSLDVGDTVVLLPSGRRARVRGLQSHGVAAERVEPGVRCAVNLQGLEAGEVERGDLLTRPDALAPTATADVWLHWLPGAPPLEQRASVELLVGTAERRARVAPVGPGAAGRRREGGSAGFARLHVDGPPLALLPGDRFVVRGFARTPDGGATWGGGLVVDVSPPHRRLGDPTLLRDLEVLRTGGAAQGLAVRVDRAGLAGAPSERLAREAGLSTAETATRLAALETEGRVVGCAGGALWLAPQALAEIERRLLAALDAFHSADPLRPGMPRASLAGALPENVAAPAVEHAVTRLAEAGAVACERDLVRRADHVARLDPDTRALAERIAREARAAGLEPAAPREWAARLGISSERFRDLVAHLERDGALVRAPGDLWFDRVCVDALRERVRARLLEGGALSTADYKALIGTSRRTAVPLMQLFDEERLTRREGDRRVLRAVGGR